MKMLNPVGKLAVVLSLSLVLGAGCASWKHGWDMKPFKATGGLDVENVKNYTGMLEKSAVTYDQIDDLIESYEYILAVQPDNREVMVSLAKAWIAMAIGHSRDLQEEGDFLRRAITISEKALMTTPEFAAAINALPEDRRNVAAAADAAVLGCGCAADTWALATLLYFDDCMSEVLKITNENVVDDVAKVLDRQVAAAGENVNPMTLALSGLAAAVRPKAKMVMVAADFDAAVKAAPDSILIRWLQAKYLFGQFGDKTSMGIGYDAIKAIDLNGAKGFTPLNRVIRLAIERTKY